MTNKKLKYTDRAELRRRAEERLNEITRTADPSGTGEETLRLFHELQVYQIELEMQNAELRQARDEVEKTLEKFTDLYDFAPVGYVTLDRTGAIHSINLTGAGFMGVARSRLIGRSFGRFVTATDRPAFTAFLGTVFSSQGKEACEVTLQNAGNLPLIVQIEAMAATSGQECSFALIDITERMRAEESLRQEKETAEELRQAKEAAEANDRAKSLFLANMSHELRTPMSGILAFHQLALKEDLAPVLREYLEMSLSSARSLLRILNDILDMAMIEAGKLRIEEEPFSLQRCLSEVVDNITPEVHRKGLDFALSVAEEFPDMLVGDQLRLRQVLINLIGNAVKFTEAGKVVVRVISGATTCDGKREITFTVTDTGIGIPDDKKELLFRAFSQVDASHSRRYGGAGLGLSISREMVKLMGGTISFDSEKEGGSTFSFIIPLREAGYDSVALSSAESLSPESTSAPERKRFPLILIAEDDPYNRKALGALLKMSNYKHDFAEDGLKAIEMWEKGEYDLVLMDVQMPRLDGLEATRAIRKKERERGVHTPIVALTAHAFKDDLERCLAAGMDAYVTKPIDINKLLQMIDKIINRKSSDDC